MGVVGIYVNGLPVEEHIKIEEIKEFTSDTLSERNDSITFIKKSIEKRSMCRNPVHKERHGKVKIITFETKKEGIAMYRKKEIPDMYAIIELLMSEGRMTINQIANSLKMNKNSARNSIKRMLQKLPNVIKYITHDSGCYLYFIDDSFNAIFNPKDIYKMYKDKDGKCTHKTLPKLERETPGKDDLSNTILELIQRSIQRLTINGKKLEVSISGSVEILFGLKK